MCDARAFTRATNAIDVDSKTTLPRGACVNKQCDRPARTDVRHETITKDKALSLRARGIGEPATTLTCACVLRIAEQRSNALRTKRARLVSQSSTAISE